MASPFGIKWRLSHGFGKSDDFPESERTDYQDRLISTFLTVGNHSI